MSQFDATDMDMIRAGDMLGPKLGARVADALAERDKDDAKFENISRAEFAATVARYGKALSEIAEMTKRQQLPITAQIHEIATSALHPTEAGHG